MKPQKLFDNKKEVTGEIHPPLTKEAYQNSFLYKRVCADVSPGIEATARLVFNFPAKAWTSTCPPAYGWDIAKTLEFLVGDPVGVTQDQRLESHLIDFARISYRGYVSFLWLNMWLVITRFRE